MLELIELVLLLLIIVPAIASEIFELNVVLMKILRSLPLLPVLIAMNTSQSTGKIIMIYLLSFVAPPVLTTDVYPSTLTEATASRPTNCNTSGLGDVLDVGLV